MKKLSMIFMAVMIAALAGCAGDSTDEGGDLAVVQNLELDATSTGRTIVLTWSAVDDDIDGYKVYFRTDATGSYTEVGDVTTTTYTDTADNAGDYVVIAYEGENTSSANSNAVSTMPQVFSQTYTIYDQFSEATAHSGFIFYDGTDYGLTGLAGQEAFHQDMSAYDDSKGDDDVALYSGSEQYSGGNSCAFQVPASGAYGNCDPNGSWYISKVLTSGDSVLFVELPYQQAKTAYAKIYGITVTEDTTTNGTKVSFSFEYQSNDLALTVFTSNAN
ncbi:MAG: fibronectin type III domain-containing protein [Candidatus Sabulitectum sp.]|nr:fibronectin type III domain-containing protein [Candidatus Sabulitectum sp.]